MARRIVLFLSLLSLACSASPSGKSKVEPQPESKPPTQLNTASSDGVLRPPPDSLATALTFTRLHRGLSRPLGLEVFLGDPMRRLFVVEQTGTVRSLVEGRVSAHVLLDVSKIMSTGNEQGLLGLAFHPRFKANGLLYINYTDSKGDTVVAQYTATTGAKATVNPASSVELLRIPQPWANHNGGYLEFGPDGLLYVGTGDGGSAGDPKRASQDSANLLGKMLRIHVDSKRVETVSVGLRNPWRFSFDSKTGDLYIADVGQNKWEEVNVVASDALVGANFGWSVREGKHCFLEKGCTADGMIEPVIEYDHDTGCSITGGSVYRGAAIPELAGAYFYSDYCSAILRSFRWQDGVVSDHWDWKSSLDPNSRLAEVTAFGTDADGEIYLLSGGGGIYKLEKSK